MRAGPLVEAIRQGLLERGWHVGHLAADSSAAALLEIGRALGTPVNPAGDRLVDTVTPMSGVPFSTLSRHSVPPHNDGLFLPTTPAIVLLHGVCVPASGGETVLIDGEQALEKLPAAVRGRLTGLEVQIAAGGLTATKNLIVDRPSGPVLTFLDPRISPTIALTCHRRPLDPQVVTAVRRACRMPPPAMSHRWRAGDLLVFDNLTFLHARRRFQGERTLRRVLVQDKSQG